MSTTYSQKLAKHIGHTIRCVRHGETGAAILCLDCEEFLVSFNKEDATVLDAINEGEAWINYDLTLILHKVYAFEEIYEFAKYHGLLVPELCDLTPLTEVEIEEFIEEKMNNPHHSEVIGEIALPLYDEESMELVANYLLIKHTPEASSLWERSKWRCIYVSERFSATGVAQL